MVTVRKFTLDGQEYSCKAWTVADKRKYFALQKDLTSKEIPEDAKWEEIIDFVAGNMVGLTKADVEAWDSTLLEKTIVMLGIANSAPKAQLMSLLESSTPETRPS